MTKYSWKLKNIEPLFFLGSFKYVADHILKNLGKSLIILPASLHDFALAWSNSLLASFYAQVDICTTDGMPLVFRLWFDKSKQEVERVYGPDLMAYLLKKSDSKVSHYFLGANHKIEKKLLHYLSSNFSNLRIIGSAFLEKNLNEMENEKIILKEVKQKSPSVLWLGIGSPKQIELAVKWKKELPKTTLVCVGAAFDLLTNSKPVAPILVKRIGFEWLFRLLLEPRRLGKRYLVKIPRFIFSYYFLKIRKFFYLGKF